SRLRRLCGRRITYPRWRRAMLRDEVQVRGHARCAPRDEAPDLVEGSLGFLRRQTFCQRVIAARLDLLAGEQVLPALHGEELVLVTEDTAIARDQLEPFLEAVRELHVSAVSPELACALGPAVVHHEKVTHALEFERGLPVESINVRLPEVAVGKGTHQER